MKMVMVVYNEALDNEVMEILKHSAVRSYTKVNKAFGRGDKSGTHLGTDIWPGLNNILYIACEEAQAQGMLIQIRELRKSLGHEGVKAFILAVEECT
ncbi:MAG: PG0541 family transporter-associated protein [Candidatus Omnitrophota bacterium]|jgi:nitrogen regulatory protein PII